MGELILFFFHLKQKWSMAFNIFFLSYTWQSVGFLFHVIYDGCFCAHVFLSSHWMTAHLGSWTLTPRVCVSVDTGGALWPARAERRLLYLFLKLCSSWVLPMLQATKNKKTHKHTQQNHAHNQHVSPPNGSVLLVTIVTVLVLKPLATSSISLYMTFPVFSVR